MSRFIFLIKFSFIFLTSILSTTVIAEKDIYVLNSHYKTSQTMFNLSDGSNYNTWTMKGSWTDNFSNFGSVNCVGQARVQKKTYLFMESVKLRTKKTKKVVDYREKCWSYRNRSWQIDSTCSRRLLECFKWCKL